MAPGGYRHEHIEALEYRYGSDEQLSYATVGVLALLIDEHSWDLRVPAASGTATVETVHPFGRLAYLRAARDGVPTDDLLELPRY